MEMILKSLRELSDEDARIYIKMLFDGYVNRKREKRLFDESAVIPKVIILTYYFCVKKPPFTNIYEVFKNNLINNEEKNFKERYIYNENKLEDIHSPEEQMGLRKVYSYIQKKEDLESVNLYTISDIHEILFSCTPYPEFGGKYRRDMKFLPGTGLDLTSPDLIVHEMNMLRSDINDLVEWGIRLGKESNPNEIINYIDKCIELKCKLIKIHPFGDGNGRSVRAFINLLFRLANLPPVYIENKERTKYGEAMNLAIGEENYSKIKGFYYYKICDSIISLDISLDKKDVVQINGENKRIR